MTEGSQIYNSSLYGAMHSSASYRFAGKALDLCH